jgi:hypothetical protein
VQPRHLQDRGDRGVELGEAGGAIEHRFDRQVRMGGGEAGLDEFRGGVDQGASGRAGHLVERIQQVAQVAEGQRPQREFAAAEPNHFRHAILRKFSPQRHGGHREERTL